VNNVAFVKPNCMLEHLQKLFVLVWKKAVKIKKTGRQSAGNQRKVDYFLSRILRDYTFGNSFATKKSNMAKLEVQWIVGFTDGEGCFHIGISANKTYKLGFQVLPEFVVVQHQRDIKLLYRLKDYFRCGVVRPNHGDRYCFRVRKLDDLSTVIVPFFEKHQLKTMKKVDFLKFRRVVRLIQKGAHLTEEGLEAIRKIKAKEFKIESNSLPQEERCN